MSASPTSSPNISPPGADAIHELELAVKDTIAPIIRQARVAWRRELPSLLKSHPAQWVAYHGERRIALGGSKTGVFQQCLRAGLPRGELLVLRIEPEAENDIAVPVDV
jgi:hypothetical protein